MRLIIILSLLLWGSLNLSYAAESSFDMNEASIGEQSNISSAINHQEFDASADTEATAIAPLEVSGRASVYEVKEDESKEYTPSLGLGLGYRYLGNLNKVGIEKSLYRQFSASLFYGRFSGKYYGADKDGLIPGLDHYSLEFNIYLNQRKKAFCSGPILKLGTHYNRLKEGIDAKQIEVDGQKVIGSGEEKWGPILGAAYFWQGRYINLTIGSEYFVLGKLKSFVPLTVSLGVAF